MKKLLERAWQALRVVQEGRADTRGLTELDAHTLRDIGMHEAADSARLEAVRRQLRFGLY